MYATMTVRVTERRDGKAETQGIFRGDGGSMQVEERQGLL